ncbi:MAG: exo-alpha-sialidase, partial [Methyloglobulus sp.]
MKPLTVKFLALYGLLLCQGCQTIHHAESQTIREISLPAKGVSKQHGLTRTADNQLLASWVESEGSKNTVRFAVYDGANWLPVRTVVSASSKLAASPVVFGMSDGSLSAFWMQGVKNDKDPYAADIYWVRSTDAGQTWTAPIKPYNTQARIYDAQMSFAPMPEDRLALVWTDSRFVNHDETETFPIKTSRYQIMAAILDKDGRIGNEMTLDNDVCSC